MKISEIKRQPDKMIIAEVACDVVNAKDKKVEEKTYNGKTWIEDSQWVLLKDGENDEDVIGCTIIGKPPLAAGDKITITPNSGNHGLQGVQVRHWMNKVGDPQCQLRVTKTASLTRNGQPYNDSRLNTPPQTLGNVQPHLPAGVTGPNRKSVAQLEDWISYWHSNPVAKACNFDPQQIWAAGFSCWKEGIELPPSKEDLAGKGPDFGDSDIPF